MTPINVTYWAEQYVSTTDDEDEYHEALRRYDTTVERCRALWDWKDLSRGVAFEQVSPVLESFEFNDLLSAPPGEAVERLGNELVERGALQNRTVVTPAFILHLADSEPDDYSTRFPLFDVRCWVAYAYLDGRRTGSDSLPAGATTSPTKYGDFCEFFQSTIPPSTPGRTYERALFRFGAYIGSLPFETVAGVDGHLEKIEDAITHSVHKRGFAIVEQGR